MPAKLTDATLSPSLTVNAPADIHRLNSRRRGAGGGSRLDGEGECGLGRRAGGSRRTGGRATTTIEDAEVKNCGAAAADMADGTGGGVAKRHLDGEIPRNWPNSSMLAPTEGGHVPPHGHIVNAALVPESAASPREAAGFILAAKAKLRIRAVTLDISLLIPEVLQSKNTTDRKEGGGGRGRRGDEVGGEARLPRRYLRLLPGLPERPHSCERPPS